MQACIYTYSNNYIYLVLQLCRPLSIQAYTYAGVYPSRPIAITISIQACSYPILALLLIYIYVIYNGPRWCLNSSTDFIYIRYLIQLECSNQKTEKGRACSNHGGEEDRHRIWLVKPEGERQLRRLRRG